MKIIFLAVALLMNAMTVLAQKKNPVSNEAFTKMMLDYYSFTIVGSQTPTSGFKVETSKPSIALKGNIFSANHRRFIINAELEGGLENGVMQLVEGNNINTYFKAGLGLNFLMPGNVASHYTMSNLEYQITNDAFKKNKMFLLRQLDTFIIIQMIIDEEDFEDYNFQCFVNRVKKESKEKSSFEGFEKRYPSGPEIYYTNLIRGILLMYKTADHINNDTLLNNFRRPILDTVSDTILTKKILQDYDRLKNELLIDKQGIADKQYDFEIALTNSLWTWKRIAWWNISMSVANSNLELYYPANTLVDSNSLLPALTASFNVLWKGKENSKFIYSRLGLTVQKSNNISELRKINYTKETVISVSATEELKSIKNGIAYQGAFKEKFGMELFVELYMVPWKYDFIPGLYLKASYRNSKAWINENKFGLDVGTIWNVTNNDKDARNVLSIIPYMSWSNLMKEYKDINKVEEKKLSDLFSFNVKLGIPINLGK